MIRDNFYIIANNIKPYAFEAVKVLALPKGVKFKARFTRKWIQSDILTYPDSLIGKKGFYVLRDWGSDQLIPLRQISVERISSLGNIVIFTYIIGDYVDYKHELQDRKKQITEFNKIFFEGISELRPSHEQNQAMTPLVFTSNQSVLIKNNNPFSTGQLERETEKWINSTSVLAEMDIFEGMAFVLPLIRDSKHKIVDVKKDGSIILYAGNRYSIELFHYVTQKSNNNASNTRKDPEDLTFMKYGPYRVNISSAFKPYISHLK